MSKCVISRFFRPMGVVPRYVKCACGNPHAVLLFDNEQQRIAHQENNLRRAGEALETVAKGVKEDKLKDPFVVSELQRAAELLKNLP